MADDPVDEKDEKIKVSCKGWCHLLGTAKGVLSCPLQCPAALIESQDALIAVKRSTAGWKLHCGTLFQSQPC